MSNCFQARARQRATAAAVLALLATGWAAPGAHAQPAVDAQAAGAAPVALEGAAPEPLAPAAGPADAARMAAPARESAAPEPAEAKPAAARADGAPAVAAPAFRIEVSAPPPLRRLIERHNDLQRYQAITDLDNAEMQRLMALAGRNLRNLLGAQGYFDPRIEVTQRPGPDGGVPVVHIAVEPGELAQVSAADIQFEGDIAQSADEDAGAQQEEIRSHWPLGEGRDFTQDAWSDAKTDALRRLIARRYPAGRISYSLADVDAPAHRVRLTLRLDSGPLYRLGPLQVSGTQRYHPALPERLARLTPGEIYDQTRLIEAQQRLTSSGYYDAAYIAISPADDVDPAAVPVQVQVTEAKLQKVTLGLGFSTDGGARLTLEHRHNRVPGIGGRALTKAQLERRHSFLETDWLTIPAADGWRWGASARIDRHKDDELITTAQQLRAGRSRSDDRFDRNFYLQYDRARVKGVDGAAVTDAQAGDGSALSFNYVWTARRFDSLTFPTRGWGLGLEVGGGFTLDGARKPFARGQVRWLGMVPLGQRAGASRLALRAEGGAVVVDQQARVPSALLFRTGGDNTVRGYGFRAIGIDRADGVVGPGHYMAAASVEWQRPILNAEGQPGPLEYIAFIDLGDVAERAQDLRPRLGIGTGVRLKTPVGPMALALAYGLKPRKFRLHLSVGFVF
ncbi:outer membrane protein assembly factor [Comamonadaceae bacterium OH2545_COT-014]|nr:outer membrane protein assembly factor [Comamonadaceae bacterium OH2545_COT-014]